jgi:hypothetical protein
MEQKPKLPDDYTDDEWLEMLTQEGNIISITLKYGDVQRSDEKRLFQMGHFIPNYKPTEKDRDALIYKATRLIDDVLFKLNEEIKSK